MNQPAKPPGPTTKTIKLSGNVPAELWNRLGTRVLPKLRAGKDLKIGIEFSVTDFWKGFTKKLWRLNWRPVASRSIHK